MPNNSQYDELILEAALIGLEQKKQEVQSRIDEIRNSLGSARKAAVKTAPAEKPAPAAAATHSSSSTHQKKRRTMSPEARERIAAAQRKRWAASKKAARKAA